MSFNDAAYSGVHLLAVERMALGQLLPRRRGWAILDSLTPMEPVDYCRGVLLCVKKREGTLNEKARGAIGVKESRIANRDAGGVVIAP